MEKKHLFIIVAIILAVYGFYVIYSTYNKPHKIISELPADFHLSADDMMQEFIINESLAISKYLDKIIAIDGNLKLIGPADAELMSIVLHGNMAIVNCELSSADVKEIGERTIGDELSVKGLFIGYDDLLGELQLKKCTIISGNSKQ